jgi:hypothetical protein
VTQREADGRCRSVANELKLRVPFRYAYTSNAIATGLNNQGRKRINLGGTSYVCDDSSFVLTSVDVPVVSQILRASEQEPLLWLRLALDMSVVREVLSQQELPEPVVSSQTHGIAIGKTTDKVLRACTRLMDLLDNPEDIPFFSNMIHVRSCIACFEILKDTVCVRSPRWATKATERQRPSAG